MSQEGPTLRVIDGNRASGAQGERVAMSFVVHECRRLDIPVSALTRVEARATQTFSDEHGRPFTIESPHVEIWLTPNLQMRLRDFTRNMVGEVMEVLVGERCVSRPAVREPLGNQPSFLLSTYDLAEAQAMAEKLRTGWRPVRAVQ